MRLGDFRISNEISTDRIGNSLCFFGKAKWECDYHPCKKDSIEVDLNDIETASILVSFDGIPCTNVMEVINLLEKLPKPGHDIIEIPGIYISYEGMTNEYFSIAMRDILALAFASIPKEFIKIDISIKEECEEAWASPSLP